MAKADQPVEWTASEYIEHQKSFGWFVLVIVAAIILSGVLHLLTVDMLGIVIVFIAMILFAITGARKPRTLKYVIDGQGIKIADKNFPFANFKSFSLIEEGAINSVQLLPLKRFQLPLSLYFPPQHQDAVMQTLSSHLPFEDRGHDPIDRLMRRVRF